MILYYILLIALTLFEAIGSVYLKRASGSDNLLKLITNTGLWAGGFLYFIAAVLNIYVLRFLDYSVAFPLKSFTYIWTVLLAYAFFKEKITGRKMIGVTLIIVGSVLISM